MTFQDCRLTLLSANPLPKTVSFALTFRSRTWNDCIFCLVLEEILYAYPMSYFKAKLV